MIKYNLQIILKVKLKNMKLLQEIIPNLKKKKIIKIKVVMKKINIKVIKNYLL